MNVPRPSPRACMRSNVLMRKNKVTFEIMRLRRSFPVSKGQGEREKREGERRERERERERERRESGRGRSGRET